MQNRISERLFKLLNYFVCFYSNRDTFLNREDPKKSHKDDLLTSVIIWNSLGNAYSLNTESINNFKSSKNPKFMHQNFISLEKASYFGKGEPQKTEKPHRMYFFSLEVTLVN
ncbi:hypothetical protein BpHYR1_034684 [Brachionus plicatilis]|uniref:Uncharacterized protein n=1 Tax=Brachionus plicatilis TaxID=10195 RepID=A0A3M7SGU0_BRAPC|nr:hypothetical protein BpHYR1_034684 [Brachionus plicatilis]